MPQSLPQTLRVYLSYSRPDAPIVLELYQRLKNEGWIDLWLDQDKLLPGQDWAMEIYKALKEADVIIFCLSNKSVAEGNWVQREIRLATQGAQKYRETIIPLRLERCEVPEPLRYFNSLDYFPQEHRNQAYRSLIRLLRMYAEKLNIDLSRLGLSKEKRNEPGSTQATSPEIEEKKRREVEERKLRESLSTPVSKPPLEKVGTKPEPAKDVNEKPNSAPRVISLLQEKLGQLYKPQAKSTDLGTKKGNESIAAGASEHSSVSKQIFISYSRNDQDFVKKLNEDLKRNQLKTWIDQAKLRGGHAWRDKIAKAIMDSQVVLVIISPTALASEWVKKELIFAEDQHKLVLPITCQNCSTFPDWFSFSFGNIQRVDFTKGSYDKNLKDLLESLKEMLEN